MKKVLAALLVLITAFLAYAFAAVSVPVAKGESVELGQMLEAPFKNLRGTGVMFLALGIVALIGALVFVFSKSRTEKTATMSSTKLAAKYAMFGRKSKGLEVGFLLNSLVALAVLAMIVFGTVKAWFDDAAIGALGAVFVLQVLMGLLFFILFLKKKDKAVLPFIPALALFLFEIAIGAFGLVSGPK